MRRPLWLNAILLLFLIGCGMLEGATFQRTGIVAPWAIAGQMTFRVWIVMKMFLAALGVSMLLQSLMDIMCPSFFIETRATRYARSGFVNAALGGTMLGVGMTLSGTGPTMLPAMLAVGVSNAWITVLGFLAGGVAFAVLDALYLSKHRVCVDDKKEKLVLDEVLGWRYHQLALPAGAVLFGFACVLEWGIPGTTRAADEERLGVGKLLWPAVVSGVVIGFNQLVYRFVAHHGQGGSTSVLVVISAVTWGKLLPRNFPSEFPKIWQTAFVWVGTTMGALASARASADETHAADGFTAWRCAVGGFLCIFGSRIAGGCTCGAGITGSSEFGIESLVITACIFGGAIVTGFIIQAASG
jgi:uncharacterized membrane protein YedE/YeeE